MYKHILLASDLTDENQDTAQKAKKLAVILDAKLSLFHAVEPIPNYGYVGITDLEDKLVDEAKKGLAKLGESLGVSEENQWVSIGPARREILSIVKEFGIDLIVIGSHTGHHLADLLGSTTNGVLHHSLCDVMTVRHGQE